jgi:hypothetical protein
MFILPFDAPVITGLAIIPEISCVAGMMQNVSVHLYPLFVFPLTIFFPCHNFRDAK